MRRLLLASAIGLLAPAAPAAPAAPTGQAASPIDAAAWLAGRWTGEGLGGRVEENWSPAIGGQMVGHFMLSKGGSPVFYELKLLDVTDAGLRLRVKHFNPDFVGWEEKGGWHAFEPVSAVRGDLRFTGLRLRLQKGELVTTILIRERGAAADSEHIVRLRRASSR
jgi:hypothetical protein